MEVVVPELGDFSDVEVIEVLVSPGDTVSPEDPLITLETDKAAMEVPAPVAGTVSELRVSVGDRVSAGDVIVLLAGVPAEASAESERAHDSATPNDGDPDRSVAEDRTVRQPRPGAQSPQPVAVAVPDLGDFSEVEVIEVLVAEGDEIDPEQGLITLETEKAAMDVPSPVGGRVIALKVTAGDRVSQGDEVVVLVPRAEAEPSAARGEEATVRQSPPAPKSGLPRPATAPTGLPPVDEANFSKAHASPSVRKLARELGADLGRVQGGGRNGRVTTDDLKAFVKTILQGGGAGLPTVPDVDFASFGPIQMQALSRIQKISGPRLQASWLNLPHVTQHDEADITELEETRQKLKDEAQARGIRLTPLAFIIRACVLALDKFPRFKSSLTQDGKNLVLKNYCHIGFAADTPNGLVVPVIRDADKMDVYALADALGTLSERAREGKLGPKDMQGGVFTLSSLGGIGGTAFTPIINAPEVAILGVSRSKVQPAFRDGSFVPRLMLPLSLSYDHRVIDGAAAVRFTTYLGQCLVQIDRLLESPPS